jgi:hypothetical protein
MIRKLILALGAAAVVGAAALVPTTASAFPHPHGPHFGHFGHFRHFGIGFYGPGYVGGDDCYLVRRIVITPFGPRVRHVQVCD